MFAKNLSLAENFLITANIVITTPYPKPFAIPSIADRPTLFFEAKDSALANMIQFTTIRGKIYPKYHTNLPYKSS